MRVPAAHHHQQSEPLVSSERVPFRCSRMREVMSQGSALADADVQVERLPLGGAHRVELKASCPVRLTGKKV